jgi:heptosyltransferase-3
MQRGRPKDRLLDYWFGIPLLNLLVTLHPKRPVPAGVDRIGVLCSTTLGDTLLFSAVLQDLRTAFPRAHIVHFYTRHNLAAAEIVPGADEKVSFVLTSPLAAIRTLRAQHLDVMFDFTSWQRLTALLTLYSGAAYTVGFRTPGQYRSRGYDRAVEHRADRHELANFRALLQHSGLLEPFPTGHAPVISVPRGSADSFPGESDIVAFHLWASGQLSALREWPEERWIELARRLTKFDAGQPRTLFVITGSPGERSRIDRFAQKLAQAGLRSAPFVSPDGFCTLVDVLLRSRLVVSVNTGVMHLAAVIGVPTISLNGPTAEHRWGARGPRVMNVQPADGSGGYLHLGFEFKGQPEDCMLQISVDQVVAAAQELLQSPVDLLA